jgi:hypothetical protein
MLLFTIIAHQLNFSNDLKVGSCQDPFILTVFEHVGLFREEAVESKARAPGGS